MVDLICNSVVPDNYLIPNQSALAKLSLSKKELIELYESIFVSVDPFSCKECYEAGYCMKRLEEYFDS